MSRAPKLCLTFGQLFAGATNGRNQLPILLCSFDELAGSPGNRRLICQSGARRNGENPVNQTFPGCSKGLRGAVDATVGSGRHAAGGIAG